MAESLAGKVAWITGGGSGLGLYLAVELARRGCDVAVSGRRVDRLAEAVAAIDGSWRNVGLNWVLGDDTGHFGWTERARVPRRVPARPCVRAAARWCLCTYACVPV